MLLILANVVTQNLNNPSIWLESYQESAIKDRYQMLMDILQEPLTREWRQEIDWSEILIQMSDEVQSCNRHQDMLALVELMREKQSKFYKQEFAFYDRFVVQYALYNQDDDLLQTGLDHFKQYPGRDIEMLFVILDFLVFYEQTEKAIELANTVYPKILSDRDLDSGLAQELAWLVITNDLEQIYNQKQQGNPLNWQQHQFQLQNYDFNLEKEWLDRVQNAIEQGFDPDNFLSLFKRSKFQPQAFLMLSIAFYSYLQTNYQMSFCCAQRIWSNICSFWDTRELKAKQQTNPNTFFGFAKPELEKYLTQKIFNPFSLKQAEGFATLWGLPYLYEFLLDQGIIREPIYKKAIAIVEGLKTELLASYKNSCELWRYDFVNRWPTDRATTDQLAQAKREKFQASFESSELLSDVPGEGHLEQMLDTLADKFGSDVVDTKSATETNEDALEPEPTTSEPQPTLTRQKSQKKKKKSNLGLAAKLYSN